MDDENAVNGIPMFSSVRLTEDHKTKGYHLRKDTEGTLVDPLNDTHCIVEFADPQDVLFIPISILERAE